MGQPKKERKKENEVSPRMPLPLVPGAALRCIYRTRAYAMGRHRTRPSARYKRYLPGVLDAKVPLPSSIVSLPLASPSLCALQHRQQSQGNNNKERFLG